jgi:hypothetical protein
MKLKKIKDFLLELFFPSFCFLCEKEGNCLCEDCKELLDISQKNRNIQIEGFNEIHYGLSFENRYSKKLIDNYLGETPLKDLSKVFVDILKDHFLFSGRIPFNKSYIVTYLSEEDKNINFNREKELAKAFSKKFNLEYSKENLENKNIILITTKLNKEKVLKFIKNLKANRIILICISV